MTSTERKHRPLLWLATFLIALDFACYQWFGSGIVFGNAIKVSVDWKPSDGK